MGEEEHYAAFEVREDDWEFERKGGYYGQKNKKRKFTKEDAMLGVFGGDQDEEDPDDEPISFDNLTKMGKGLRSFVKSKHSGGEEPEGQDVEMEESRGGGDDDDDGWGSVRRSTLGGLGLQERSRESSPKPRSQSQTQTQTRAAGQGPPRAPKPSIKEVRKTEESNNQKYGIGAKLLRMMGYKEGEGAGKNKQGIVEPIEIKVRPGKQGINYGGFKEKTGQVIKMEKQREASPASGEEGEEGEEGAEEEGAADSWKAAQIEARLGKRGQRKKVYKTVEELIAENEAKGPQQTQIFDMRGPVERVVTSVAELSTSAPKVAYRPDSHFPELRHNLRLLADLTAGEIQNIDRNMRRESELRARLDLESVELSLKVQSEEKKVERAKKLRLVIQECQERMQSRSSSFTIESFSALFGNLKLEYAEEYKAYSLSSLAVAVASPLLKQLLATWDPLAEPLEHLDLFKEWKGLLVAEAERDGRMTPYESLMYHIWLPKVRSSISNSWNPRDFERVIQLIEGWEGLVPKWMTENIYSQLILPKLTSEVGAWDPRKDPTPIHSWLHPWLPFLGEALQPLYVPIRHKLGTVLELWHPSDPSANAILYPWKNVFRREDLQRFLAKHIHPKLVQELRQFEINPADQKLEPFRWVMKWGNLLSPNAFVSLWTSEFFPKWSRVLASWLAQSPNLDEVRRWVAGWKEMFPKPLLAQEAIRAQFDKIDLVALRSRAFNPSAPPSAPLHENADKERDETLRRYELIKQGLEQGEVKKKAHAPAQSVKDTLEQLAEKNGIVFLPTDKTHNGKPVYQFGPQQILIDKEVVRILFQGDWNVITPDDLVLFST